MRFIKNSLLYLFLYLLPKNWLSNLMGRFSSHRFSPRFARIINHSFAKRYSLNMAEAEKPLDDYPSLQELFIRKLRFGLRPIPDEKNIIISPCDGMLSQMGKIEQGRIIQAKGKNYLLEDLIGDPDLAKKFLKGFFATLYLSPKDYHRFHVPLDGKIIKTLYIPGMLWPVNNWAVTNITNLFCQNERIITVIETPSGLLAHIAIAATMVGKIDLQYCHVEPVKKKRYIVHDDIQVKKGDELGKFLFGSTIVLLCAPDLIHSFMIEAPKSVQVGHILAKLATLNKPNKPAD